jgi:hypothetical protein
VDVFGFADAGVKRIVEAVRWVERFRQRSGSSGGATLHHRRGGPVPHELIGDVRKVSGASDTLVDSDWGQTVNYSNSGDVAVTIDQATLDNGFPELWWCEVSVAKDKGPVTITPTTSKINGASSYKVYGGQSVKISSDGNKDSDGGNYFVNTGRAYHTVQDNGTDKPQEPKLNFIAGSNITVTVADTPANQRTDVTIAANPSLTVQEDDGSPSVSGCTVLQVKATTFVLTNPSGTTALLNVGWGTNIQDVGTANAPGSGIKFAREDHVHNWAGVKVRKNTTGSTYTRRRINFIEGSNVTLTLADDAGNDEVDVTIASSGGGGSGTLLAIYVKTSGTAATHTTGASTTKLLVECWGGGGGAGGVNGTQGAASGGGASGGYCRKLYTGLSPSLACTYTVGAGGAGGAAGSASVGTAGGNTTFQPSGGTLITAKGGGGGTGSAGLSAVAFGGTSGGVSTNGDVNGAGVPGDCGLSLVPGGGTDGLPGNGGSTSLGGGGPQNTNAAGGNATANTGSGGGGTADTGNPSGHAGGNGAAGLIVIYEYS